MRVTESVKPREIARRVEASFALADPIAVRFPKAKAQVEIRL